jgi:hypothetical protein
MLQRGAAERRWNIIQGIYENRTNCLSRSSRYGCGWPVNFEPFMRLGNLLILEGLGSVGWARLILYVY